MIIPDLESVQNRDGAIRVVTTTGIIGDVVSSIAGEDAEVVALMAADQDPHSYQTTAGDLRMVTNADVIFVNGWNLEQSLIADLENAAGTTPIVPVSARIEPRLYDSSTVGEESNRIDPHVWLSPLNTLKWVENIESVLSTLDPENAGAYSRRAETYSLQLSDLDAYYREQIELLDDNRRVLVTNHDAFGYFADDYGFAVVGTIIPGDSALAEPASRDLATLVERMREASVCSIFVEHSANERLASQLAEDLDHCDTVKIVSLYSGALGGEDSGANTYLDMMRMNVDRIAGALGTLGSSSNNGQGKT